VVLNRAVMNLDYSVPAPYADIPGLSGIFSGKANLSAVIPALFFRDAVYRLQSFSKFSQCFFKPLLFPVQAFLHIQAAVRAGGTGLDATGFEVSAHFFIVFRK
jgi:hypothetical protein